MSVGSSGPSSALPPTAGPMAAHVNAVNQLQAKQQFATQQRNAKQQALVQMAQMLAARNTGEMQVGSGVADSVY